MNPTNKLGIHALVFAGDTSDGSIDEAISGAKGTGYDILELSLHDLGRLDTDRTKAKLEQAGLQLVCSRGLTFDADPSSDDPAVVERGAGLLRDSIQAAAGMGATLYTGALYGALGKYPRPVTARGIANATSVIKELAQEAQTLGISLGIEVCNRYETNCVNTAAQALRLIDAIGEDGVYLHLDTYHMNIEEDDFVAPVVAAGDRLGYVHVGENHRGHLGSGHVDFTGFFHALRGVSYLGPITFESFSSTVVAKGLSTDLAIWRDLWDDGFALAQHAHAFIEAHLEATANHVWR
ncbi:MAG: sugar phosphate isomerase/epimerase [Micrococcales bacterium]|nr:sugar phosphate isomerase/epimerase [Micrococcales bacterium]